MLAVEEDLRADFEARVCPHMGAAYNLARWLTRQDQAAEDAVQEAFLRAYKAYRGYRGGSARAWLLTIVRRACYDWLSKNGGATAPAELDEDAPGEDQGSIDPAALTARSMDAAALRAAIERLPPEFREAIVLRELEGLSYQEIAAAAEVPLGTVMSRLSRARSRLERVLGEGR
jgi:RNA polymerase sigma-70 factor (ECF subfamily)